MSKAIRPDFDLFATDELVESIAEASAASPAFADAVDDAVELKQLIDELVRLRKRAGLTQSQLAALMDVRQPTVSQFETESSDPRLSTLQRYARAVGSRVSICVIDNEGVFAPQNSYRTVSDQPRMNPVVEIKTKSQARAWKAEHHRSAYDLAR